MVRKSGNDFQIRRDSFLHTNNCIRYGRATLISNWMERRQLGEGTFTGIVPGLPENLKCVQPESVYQTVYQRPTSNSEEKESTFEDFKLAAIRNRLLNQTPYVFSRRLQQYPQTRKPLPPEEVCEEAMEAILRRRVKPRVSLDDMYAEVSHMRFGVNDYRFCEDERRQRRPKETTTYADSYRRPV